MGILGYLLIVLGAIGTGWSWTLDVSHGKMPTALGGGQVANLDLMMQRQMICEVSLALVLLGVLLVCCEVLLDAFARAHGWMCKCGERIIGEEFVRCPKCGVGKPDPDSGGALSP